MTDTWWTDPTVFKALGLSKSLTVTDTDYLGGWAAHPKTHRDKILKINDQGVGLRGFATIFTIPWTEVQAIEVEGADQASKRVTAGRVLAVGVFALAAKKTSRQAVVFVRLRDGSEACFRTSKVLAPELRAKLAPILSHLRQAAPATVAPDPVEQIRRLGELRDQGVLTEDEFAAKKAALLERL